MSTYRVWYHRTLDESASVEVDAEDRAAAIAASDALLAAAMALDLWGLLAPSVKRTVFAYEWTVTEATHETVNSHKGITAAD